MPDDNDPYEMDDAPFADDPAGDADEDADASSDLDQLAAAAASRAPASVWGDRPPLLDADGRLDEDIRCRDCGYNLRGQLPAGSCPECGTLVERSLASNHLRFANPQWLAALHTGATFLAIGTLCMIPTVCLVGIVGGMVIAAQTYRSGGSSVGQPLLAAAFVGILVSLATTIVLGFGTWKLCAPEPGTQGTAADPTTRKLGRYLVLPGYGLSLFISLFTLIPVLAVYRVIDLTSSLIGVVVLVGFSGSVFYLKHLAARVPDPGLVTQSRIVGWGLTCSLGLSILAQFASYAALGFVSPTTSRVSGALAYGSIFFCFVAVGILIFGIWWIVLMFRFRAAFADALRRAGRGY